jgi:putative intracellular protease/amidase
VAKRLLVILFDGVADWEVGFPLFCLRPRITWEFASPGLATVRTAMGFEIGVTATHLAAIRAADFDGIYLPGGTDPETGRFPRRLGEHTGLRHLLRTFAEANKVVAAICGAPLVVGAAGLLRGRRFASDVSEDTRGWFEGASRTAEPLCREGLVLTGSVSAIIPFCRELAHLLGEEETAGEIEAFFVR